MTSHRELLSVFNLTGPTSSKAIPVDQLHLLSSIHTTSPPRNCWSTPAASAPAPATAACCTWARQPAPALGD